MKFRLFAGAVALVAATVVVTTAMIAPQDEKPGGGEMTQDEQMKAWITANQPNDHHKKLQEMVGEWSAENTHYNPDGSVMSKTSDSAVNKSILGGRYILQHYSGDFGGMPFEGVGMMGFDNGKNEFVHVWFDNFSTAPMVSRGKAGKNPNQTTTFSEMPGPTGEMMRMEWVSTIASKDEHELEMWASTPAGRVKQMHIKYKRK